VSSVAVVHLLSITKVRDARIVNIVIPAQAGIHRLLTVAKWIPAFAGMTPVLRKLSLTVVR
jgi:hypothetical protein